VLMLYLGSAPAAVDKSLPLSHQQREIHTLT
jgi:hypothetical protein